MIYRWGGGYTYMHMQSTPMHPKATYHCHNGEMFSLTSKTVFPISRQSAEDGCFATIPVLIRQILSVPLVFIRMKTPVWFL